MTPPLVLCYHAVSDSWPAMLTVTPRRLEQQLGLLVGRGYHGATFTQAVTRPSDERTLVVTFDDAYRSVIEHAFPILARLGLPGTVYAVTGGVGANGPMAWPGIDQWLGGPHENELTGVSWSNLKTLAGAGWEIGSHTRTHPHLTRLSDTELQAELTGSREDCEGHLGMACRSLAYPYGDVDARVVEATRAAGYEAACALPKGRLHGPDPLCWPRIGVYRKDASWRYRLKVSPLARRIRNVKRAER